MKKSLLLLAALFGWAAWAESQPTLAAPLVPVPDAISSAQPTVTTPAAAPVCKQATIAEKYTVYVLSQCGVRLKDTGLRGAINRRNSCAVESVLAEVFAGPVTCETCATQSKVEALRCDRKNACVCGNADYVKALATDLMDSSKRVRHAAERNLEKCGYRVVKDRVCVETEVPSAILY